MFFAISFVRKCHKMHYGIIVTHKSDCMGSVESSFSLKQFLQQRFTPTAPEYCWELDFYRPMLHGSMQK